MESHIEHPKNKIKEHTTMMKKTEFNLYCVNR